MFLNIIGFVYSNLISLFIEFKLNLIDRLYNYFHVKSVENIVQSVEKLKNLKLIDCLIIKILFINLQQIKL